MLRQNRFGSMDRSVMRLGEDKVRVCGSGAGVHMAPSEAAKNEFNPYSTQGVRVAWWLDDAIRKCLSFPIGRDAYLCGAFRVLRMVLYPTL